MKKGISSDKVQRMRNLVSGNYHAKTKISTGYTKSKVKYSEGDVWEENGKTWTIENGIKQTINKLDEARKSLRIPLTCPKCKNGKMTHPAHKKMYLRYGMCMNCVSMFEKELRSTGKYDDYVKEISKNSNEDWIKHVTEEYQDWLNNIDSKKYITEAGDIENWSGGESKKSLESKFLEKQKEIQKQLEDEYGNSK